MKKLLASSLPVTFAAMVLLLVPLSSAPEVVQAQLFSPDSLPVSTEDDSGWQRFALDDELSFLVPVRPTVLTQSGDRFFYEGSSEKILEERRCSGYSNGFIFAIDSYRVKNPNKLMKDMLDNTPTYLRFEEDVILDGFTGKHYRTSGGAVYYVATLRHVYQITLAVSDEANTALSRFVSSLRLGNRKAMVEPKTRPPEPPEPPAIALVGITADQTSSQEETFSPKDTTRKARIIWRPPPIYTKEARENNLHGTVVLRAVFSSSGYVTNIKVVSGLAKGLTENAVEAARSIRFFPAEKDGKPVSQYIQIEYNFNLY